MTEDEIIILIGGVLLLTFIVVLIIICIVKWPQWQEQERQRRAKLEEEYAKEPEYVFQNAKVLSKRKSVYYQPSLRMMVLPEHGEQCYATFLMENGDTGEYPVREELWMAIEENQEGTLVTINGNFFDFGDGEEVEEEPLGATDNEKE